MFSLAPYARPSFLATGRTLLTVSQNSFSYSAFFGLALVAQLVEHLICNQGVGGSSPSGGTINIKKLELFTQRSPLYQHAPLSQFKLPLSDTILIENCFSESRKGVFSANHREPVLDRCPSSR